MTATGETTDNQQAIRRLYGDVWTKGDLELVDHLFTEDFEHLGPAVTGEFNGPDGYKAFVKVFRTAFPDTKIDIVEMIEEGETVAVRWVGHGTHEGEFWGIDPTNQRTATPGVSFVHFDNGEISDIWDIYDTQRLLRQLGVADPL